MNSVALDKVSAAHQQEVAKLRRGRRRLQRIIFFLLFAVFISLSFTVSSIPNAISGSAGVERARQELLTGQGEWRSEFSRMQKSYASWLNRHGLEVERRVFNHLSQLLMFNVAKIGPSETFVSNLMVAFNFSLLRMGFMLIACWRIWLVGILLSAIYVYRNWKTYDGKDILGQMSTGQLFYSGLKADLSNVSATGAPEKQVTGLACPQFVSETEGNTSSLGKLLKRWNVDNRTNQMLVRILQAYKSWPAYVTEIDSEQLFSKYFSGANLVEHASKVLDRLLALHKQYHDHHGEADLEPHFEGSEVADEKVSCSEYAWLLQHSCHRVLTPAMREEIGRVQASLVATLILSHFAGKIMAYGFQGGKWIRRSNFPELCARAVLHSIPDFGEEYEYEERAIVRRSLVYGSRKNIFAPVRFPTDLSFETRALRQWVELLMALPHELQANGDEVELLGLLHEMHARWSKGFFDAALTMQKEMSEGTIATQSNLFIVPVENLVALTQRLVPAEMLHRVEELTALVSQKQRLDSMKGESGGADSALEKGALFNQGKIFPPLSPPEVRELAALHRVSENLLADWSPLRAMLNHYGWLARRVGDYSVPESGVIFSVVRTDGSVPGANSLGLIGRAGMVAIRGTRLEQQWGKAWQVRFVQGVSATMAEKQEDFDKLMRGIEERAVDESELNNIAGVLAQNT